MNDEIFNENTADNAPEEKSSAASGANEKSPVKKSNKEKKPKNKKKKKWLIVLLLCLLLPVVLVIGTVAGVYFSLMSSYNKISYVEVPIVERTNPYVEPPTDPQAPVWEEAEPPKEEDIGRDFVEPGKPIPKEEVGGGGSPQQGDNYDRNASFGRNANAKSVYGKTPIYKVAKKDPNIENILIIGTDSRDVTRERGRSDALIVLSYNKKTNEIKMISILRDSLVPIEGHGWSRINHAYSWDGVGLCVNTVNELFDLDIQRFVVVDFNGVTDFIDKIGGIDMYLTQKEADYIDNYSGRDAAHEGVNHLNGDRALVYMRIRKIDSDFKRTERQRKVIEAVAKKIIAEKNMTEILDLTEFAFGLIKTNITFTELTGAVTDIATTALIRRNIDIQTQHVPYSDAYQYKYYNGMAIVSFNIDNAARRMHEFIYG